MRSSFQWLLVSVAFLGAQRLVAQQIAPLNPAAWGGDHVGQLVPAFTSGDECLFCHRNDVGPTWSANRHGQTVRIANPEADALQAFAKMSEFKAVAAEIELLVGRGSRVRYLKRSAEHGKLDLLATKQPQWDKITFGSRCAGCHATAVDSTRQTFSAISHDCFVCHGEPPEKHTTEPEHAILSPQRSDSAAVVTSICAQCHLRTGASRSTGLPYPNNFVAGDNLFRDFQVDLSEAALQTLNPGDRHVQENVRDVVLHGRNDVTCLSCHDVHRQSARKHHTVAASGICRNCHENGSKKERMPYEVHSAVCGY